MNADATPAELRDRERWPREELRRLRGEVAHLRGYVAQLESVLAIALRVAVQGRSCSELELLAAIEGIEAMAALEEREAA